MTNCFPSKHMPSRLRHSRESLVDMGAFACLCLGVFISAVLMADDGPILRREVEELIQRLDASSLLERSRAERQLLEIGPEALPFLPAPDLIESVAAREAVRRIRPQLERRAARESAAPSRVSLQGEYSGRDLIDQIQRQTRNHLSLADATDDVKKRRLSVNWDNRLFWECLDELCQRCDLEWRLAKGSATIRLNPRGEKSTNPMAVQSTDSFHLSVRRVEVRDVVGNAKERILRVSGTLCIEPRLRPLFISMQATNMSAITDADRLLSPWSPNAKYEFPVSDGGREVPVQWDFLLPAEIEPKTIAIKGRLKCEIAAATERVVFDHKSLTRGTIRRRGGVTVRIREVTFNSNDREQPAADIGVTVSYDVGGPAFESHRSWMFHNAAYLESKTAARIDFTDFETNQQADGAVAVDYHFKKLDAPIDKYVFVYEAPTLIISVPVEIDLSGMRID